MSLPIYLVSFVKHNGFPRMAEFVNDLMGAVTLCQWLDEERIRYTLGWVDEDNVHHEGCEAIVDKLDEARREERYLREASCRSWELPHSSCY
jgi:hypothetical protein